MTRCQRLLLRWRRFNDRRFALQITIDIDAFGPFHTSNTTLRDVARQRNNNDAARNRRRPDSAQQRFVFNKLLLKQHTGFESVQAEHTLAKPGW